MRSSLFLGIQMRAEESEYQAGDYLVRNIIGADQESGALHIASQLEGTPVVQFHLRDGRAAREDLEFRLDAQQAGRDGAATPAGALLFSCLGRGRGLFGVADHDSTLFRQRIGAVPLAGFFGNGEIGPINGTTFLHGYTSAFGLFYEKSVFN